MTKLSNTQANILTQAAKTPSADVRTFMKDLKSPAIRDKVLQSMVKHGYVAEQPMMGAHPEKGEKVYAITEAGIAAAGNTAQHDATPCNTKQQKAAPSNEPKRETKQSAIIDLLSKPEGTTLAQLIEATGWKPHSVRGHLSNLRKKRGLDIETFTTGEGTRGYRIPQDQEAA